MSENATFMDLDMVLDSVYNGIIILDQKGMIYFFNRATEDILNLNLQKSIGRHYIDVFREGGVLNVLQKVEKAQKSGEVVENYKLNIGAKMILVSCTSMVKDEEIKGVVVVFQDTSDLDLIAEELRTVRHLNMELDAIINNSYDGIWVIDGQGMVININITYENFSHLKVDEMIGRNIYDLVQEGYFSDSAAVHVLNAKQPQTVIQDIKTGKRAMVTAVPIFDEQGSIWRIVSNVRDITELLYLKEKLETTEAESQKYRAELEQLKLNSSNLKGMVSTSYEMKKILELAHRVAKVDSTVLVLGESGVGKGVLVSTIHESSYRKNGSLITINCGTLPENILEAELFGYEKGAFTGASKDGKMGLVELADQGTLFLDEIAELPLHLQTKLLQVLQNQTFYRVGGRKAINVSTRIIAATNKDLSEMVGKGQFREDLFYRLYVVPITVPPLRERNEDIPLLIHHFIVEFNQKYSQNKKIPVEVTDILTNYDWPGNVRELENLIERLVVTTQEEKISIGDLPQKFVKRDSYAGSIKIPLSSKQPSFKSAMDEFEKDLIKDALKKYGSFRHAAQHLGLHHSTLTRKAQKHKLDHIKK